MSEHILKNKYLPNMLKDQPASLPSHAAKQKAKTSLLELALVPSFFLMLYTV